MCVRVLAPPTSTFDCTTHVCSTLRSNPQVRDVVRITQTTPTAPLAFAHVRRVRIALLRCTSGATAPRPVWQPLGATPARSIPGARCPAPPNACSHHSGAVAPTTGTCHLISLAPTKPLTLDPLNSGILGKRVRPKLFAKSATGSLGNNNCLKQSLLE